MRNTFKAYERLKREQHIDTLFRKGKAYSVLPIRLIYLLLPRQQGEIAPVRVGFSVPKKKFSKAVHRNRIKRLMREAWRLNKAALYDAIPQNLQLHLFINFTDTTLPEYEVIVQSVLKGIDKLKKELPANA